MSATIEAAVWALKNIAAGAFRFDDPETPAELVVWNAIETFGPDGVLMEAGIDSETIEKFRSEPTQDTLSELLKEFFSAAPGGEDSTTPLSADDVYGTLECLALQLELNKLREEMRWRHEFEGALSIQDATLRQQAEQEAEEEFRSAGFEVESARATDQQRFLRDRLAGLYCRIFARDLPRILKRAAWVQELPIVADVPAVTQRLLQEAARCFVYGQHLGCLSICRAICESAVKDRLRRNESPEATDESTLGDAIRRLEALRIPGLGPALASAKAVNKFANQVLHPSGELPSSEDCRDAFCRTRKVVKELCR